MTDQELVYLSPIVTSKAMAEIERLAIHEGASEEAFMEEAGLHLAEAVTEILHEHPRLESVILLVGRGNNGGDALCAGTYLLRTHINVKALCLFKAEESSKLNQHHRQQFRKIGGEILTLKGVEDLEIGENDLVLDGLLGTGFHGKTEGLLKDVIEKLNTKKAFVVAVDIPSGLDRGHSQEGACVQAKVTCYLELAKLEFFEKDAFDFVGQLKKVTFGLADCYKRKATCSYYLLEEDVKMLLPPIKRTRHKYQTGYIVALAGSPGMGGAAALASMAAMRSGAGIVRLFHPQGMEEELGIEFKELIKTPLMKEDTSVLFKEIKRAKALLIGPGMGHNPWVQDTLLKILQTSHLPAVIDADALEVFANHMKGSSQARYVLTPHKMEMQRCLKLEKDIPDEEFFHLCQTFVSERDVILVLKGAPTRIFSSTCKPIVMARGDPGMAKAGTGDVLTGVIAAYLSQGLTPFHAALLGCYVHALSGELAAYEKSSYGVLASDLIEKIPAVYKQWLF